MLELTPPLTALPRSRIEGQMDVAARHLWPKAPVMLGMCGEEPRVRLMSMPRLRAPSLRGGVSGWEAGVGIIVVNSVGQMVPVESRAMQVSVRSWREEAMIRAVREVTVRGGLSWCWAIHEVDWPTRVSLRVRMFGSLRRGRTGKLGVGV